MADFLCSDGLSVFPSQMALLETREKLADANSSHDLLKKMLDELSHISRQTQEKIVKVKLGLPNRFDNASLSMAHARFDAGDFSQQVMENEEETSLAQYHVQVQTEKTQAGVVTPKFELIKDGPDANSMMGLSKGGLAIAKVKDHYQSLLRELALLATLQAQYTEIEKESEKIRLRVNIIEQVTIPNLERALIWIIEELDDRDREEFYRRKRIQQKKLGPRRDRAQDVNSSMAGASSKVGSASLSFVVAKDR